MLNEVSCDATIYVRFDVCVFVVREGGIGIDISCIRGRLGGRGFLSSVGVVPWFAFMFSSRLPVMAQDHLKVADNGT